MPDDTKRPGILRRAWKFTTQKLNHPPPSWAPPPFPAFTPDGATPVRPVIPQPSPPAPVEQQPETEPPAKEKPARTPEENAKLEAGAKLRRDMHAAREARARERQAETHRQAAEELRERLDASKATGIQRLAAEGKLDEQHRDEGRSLAVVFTVAGLAVESSIDAAFEAGHFSDPLATTLSAAFDRAASNDGPGHGDDGGRAIGD